MARQNIDLRVRLAHGSEREPVPVQDDADGSFRA
jgi:hypothetical protein